MAEAVVEDRGALTRFYCHMCNVEINIPNTDYTCPHCSGGFVEELPAESPLPAAGGLSHATSSGANASDGVSFPNVALGFNHLDALRGEIATLLMSRNGPNVEISIDPGNRRGNLLTLNGGGSTGSSAVVGSSGGGPAGGRVRPQNLDRLDNVLLDFLQSISGGDVGNSQMFFMGNPGDYAWGREGIDTIVTQLLNQMETSGPPPLAKDKIAEIPKVEITSEDLERKSQCSVCWEDFRQQEIVRKLPCSHIYHENCIVPWLDLHGTCPICRKSLTDDGSDDGENHDDGRGSDVTTTRRIECPLHRNPATGGGVVGSGHNTSSNATASSTTANGAATTSQTQNQRNNVFVFGIDDDNVELD